MPFIQIFGLPPSETDRLTVNQFAQLRAVVDAKMQGGRP